MVALILVGATLRLWRLSELGLVHFDEGVYAISGLWETTPSEEPRIYPKQILFSPPLFFSLVKASYWALGRASDTAANLVSVVVGTLSILLMWGITRRWFGYRAGVAAAALVAFSDFHIAYSRMVLTDITFGFFYLLSLASINESFHRKSFGWAIISGLTVGVAWNTKYHGWLLLLVALTTVVASVIFDTENRTFLKRLTICFLIMTVVSIICYLPWALYVQSQPGGYLSLTKYQRVFLSRDWLGNILHQMKAQLYFDGWMSRFSAAVAFILSLIAVRNRHLFTGSMIFFIILLLAGAGLAFGGASALAALSILAILFVKGWDCYPRWLLLASIGIFFLLTPLYHPYPRLTIPLMLTIYITAGVSIGKILLDLATNPLDSKNGLFGRLIKPIFAVGAVLFGIIILTNGIRPTPRTWIAKDSFREAAVSISRLLPKDSVVLVHGEPAIVYYLRLYGYRAIPIDYPIDNPKVRPFFHQSAKEHFLVTGIYAEKRNPVSKACYENLKKKQLFQIGIFPVQPNDVRLLNDYYPTDALEYRMNPTNEYDLHLYRINNVKINMEDCLIFTKPYDSSFPS
jgi:4-amino-4-deoxy-L-arabinose transferase-like glycosyltransferase